MTAPTIERPRTEAEPLSDIPEPEPRPWMIALLWILFGGMLVALLAALL